MHKRGSTQTLWWLINIFFLAVILLSLLYIINSFSKTNVFERRYLAKDIALTLNNLYASPNNLEYAYTENDFSFDVLFTPNQVRVIDAKEGEITAKTYYFIEDENIEFNYKKIKSSVIENQDEEETPKLALGFRRSYRQINPNAIIRTSDVLNG